MISRALFAATDAVAASKATIAFERYRCSIEGGRDGGRNMRVAGLLKSEKFSTWRKDARGSPVLALPTRLARRQLDFFSRG